jgi:acyl-CoA dehydrogenase
VQIELTEDVASMVATVRDFVRRELEPNARLVEETNSVPQVLIDRMAALGLFGLTIPTEYGGLGLGLYEYCLIGLELARTHPAFRSRMNINNGIGSRGLMAYGTDEQKRRYLPGLATGQRIAAFALSEADAGSDASHLKTTATQAPGGYVLRGAKMFITNAPIANTILVMATLDPSLGSKGVTALLVDTLDAEPAGLVRGRPFEKMGFRGSLTSPLTFEDVFVPTECVIGPIGGGFGVAMTAVNDGRVAIAASAIGSADYLLSLSLEHARSRVQFGQPIGEFQSVQHMLANMGTEIELAKNYLLATARERDSNSTDFPLHASMIKLFGTEMACRVADSALQIFGGYGYMKDLPIERYYRDLRLLRITEGTSEIQRNFIGRRLLSDPAAVRV